MTMPGIIHRVQSKKRLTGADFNILADRLNMITPMRQGRRVTTTRGTYELRRPVGGAAVQGGQMVIVKITGNAAGGGYYTADPVQLKEAKWDSSTPGHFTPSTATLTIPGAQVAFKHNESENDTITLTGDLETLGDWSANNFIPGMELDVNGSSQNDSGIYIINNIEGTKITLSDPDNLVDEVDGVNPITFTGSLVVLNIHERPSGADPDSHKLQVDDLMLCWPHLDDAGNVRLIGTDAWRYKECET